MLSVLNIKLCLEEPECDVDSAEENTKPESQDSWQHSDDKADLFSYFRLRSFTEMITVGWISKIMRVRTLI